MSELNVTVNSEVKKMSVLFEIETSIYVIQITVTLLMHSIFHQISYLWSGIGQAQLFIK